MIHKGLFSSVGRCVASLMIAALVLTTSDSPLAATPAARGPQGISAGASDATDFSAARRRRHYYRRGGDAAALAFMGLAIGTIAGAIAAQQRYDYYDHGYYYGPGYYGGPYYYGRPYYGRRFYYRRF